MAKRIILDRAAMFKALRKDTSTLFNRRLAQSHVDGIEAILDSADRHGVTDIDHVAQILAQVYKETGTYMLGIKETVMPSHTDKRPSDATVIKRLNNAFAKGQLTWVSTPYWRDGAFGRGPIQITHWPNYEKMGTVLGVPLRQKPELALDTKIGADIAVVGMSKGMFTGRKLSDYSFPSCLDADWKDHPRRIVNGKDGTDQMVSDYHRGFRAALVAGGYAYREVITAEQITTDKITAISVDKRPAGSIQIQDWSSVVEAKVKDAVIDAVVPASKWDWLIKLVLKFLGDRRV